MQGKLFPTECCSPSDELTDVRIDEKVELGKEFETLSAVPQLLLMTTLCKLARFFPRLDITESPEVGSSNSVTLRNQI